MSTDPDFLAVAYIMGGGVWGRSGDRTKAVDICKDEAYDFIEAIGMRPKPDAHLTVNVFDLTDTGLDQMRVGDDGVCAVDESGKAIFMFTTCEHETIEFKPRAKKKR